MVTVYQRAFEERPRSRHFQEFLLVYEVIVAAVDFARARVACRVRNRQPDARIGLEQRGNECGFAGAGRCAHDKKIAAHSIFWICSLICSISSFRSSATLVTSVS